MSSQRLNRRILKELTMLMEDPDVQSYFQYESEGNHETLGTLEIYGYLLPHTEPYKHGAFKVRITFPMEYPFKIPKAQLLTYIYHPMAQNIISDPYSSPLCTCCYEWSPRYTLSKLIKHIVDAIDQPAAIRGRFCVLNGEALDLYGRDRNKYNEIAMEMVKKHAYSRVPSSIISLKLAVKTMILKQLNHDSKKISQLNLCDSLKDYLNKIERRSVLF